MLLSYAQNMELEIETHLLKELDIDPRHGVGPLELLHLVLDLFSSLRLELETLVMVEVTRGIVEVALDIGSSGSPTCLHLLVVLIAAVISHVVAPLPPTDPAEFMTTGMTPTGHVVTASVLLNHRPTFGAVLGIGLDPVRGFRVVALLLEPEAEVLAFYWSMPWHHACEAEGVATAALDRGPPC